MEQIAPRHKTQFPILCINIMLTINTCHKASLLLDQQAAVSCVRCWEKISTTAKRDLYQDIGTKHADVLFHPWHIRRPSSTLLH